MQPGGEEAHGRLAASVGRATIGSSRDAPAAAASAAAAVHFIITFYDNLPPLILLADERCAERASAGGASPSDGLPGAGALARGTCGGGARIFEGAAAAHPRKGRRRLRGYHLLVLLTTTGEGDLQLHTRMISVGHLHLEKPTGGMGGSKAHARADAGWDGHDKVPRLRLRGHRHCSGRSHNRQHRRRRRRRCRGTRCLAHAANLA